MLPTIYNEIFPDSQKHIVLRASGGASEGGMHEGIIPYVYPQVTILGGYKTNTTHGVKLPRGKPESCHLYVKENFLRKYKWPT